MPDKRTHRGQNPADSKLFAAGQIGHLRQAVGDFSVLLTKGYAAKSALKLVGDRFSLTARQRLAVMRCACSDEQLFIRRQSEVKIADIAGQPIVIDGYNLLITIESAMSGAVIFQTRDGCFKDLASIHGTYRKVTETIPAVKLIGEFLHARQISPCLWLLDSPVSNSGRLKMLLLEIADQNSWNWQVELLISPDAEMIKTRNIVASSDGIILDGCKKWVNLAREIIEEKLPQSRLVNLT